VAFDAAMQQAILGQNYPNPCQSTAQIAVNNAPAGSYIEVLSVDGKLLMAQPINSTVVTINTENLNAGQYLYRIITPGQIAGQVRSMEVVK
ncbi:MAG TPA: T9SS type A sorting domain-containing protein, partial [Chitinophagales bacterium]|nr:T9SS type A sorting domain-containing protein [Chitinophagales bacterium]